MSSDKLARTIPIMSPTVNRKIKPRAHSIAADHLIFPLCKVANQLKTWTPVGMAIITVAEVK